MRDSGSSWCIVKNAKIFWKYFEFSRNKNSRILIRLCKQVLMNRSIIFLDPEKKGVSASSFFSFLQNIITVILYLHCNEINCFAVAQHIKIGYFVGSSGRMLSVFSTSSQDKLNVKSTLQLFYFNQRSKDIDCGS